MARHDFNVSSWGNSMGRPAVYPLWCIEFKMEEK